MAFGVRQPFAHHTARAIPTFTDAERAAAPRCVICQRITGPRDGKRYPAGETTALVCHSCRFDPSLDIAKVLAEIAAADAAAPEAAVPRG